MSELQGIREIIQGVLPEITSLRHTFHQFPELTWCEEQTGHRIARQLEQIPGMQVKSGVAKFGVIGLLEGGLDGPTIALRADMDALPITEATNLAYSSQSQGVMHACGHDGHMAALLGAAKVLSKLRSKLKGRIKFIFQPAEEGGAGALEMCNAGVLSKPKVDVVFGLHAWPEAPLGSIWVKPGPIMASNTEIKVSVRGKGCHAAMPHLGTDQVLVAARMIDAMQSLVSRHVSPSDPVALSITKVEAGRATNVIPELVVFEGTLRAVRSDVRLSVIKALETMLEGLASAHGVSVQLTAKTVYPETVNHEGPAEYVYQVGHELFGAQNVKRIPSASMGAEDFSFYLERVPGAFFFLGVNEHSAADSIIPLHHPKFNFNDKALPVAIKMFSQLALGYADQLQIN